MKVSLKWLNEYVEVPTDIKAFCDKLDLTGTGVEGVETLGATFDHVVTAKVLKKSTIPIPITWGCAPLNRGQNPGKDGKPEPLQNRVRRAELQRRRPHRHGTASSKIKKSSCAARLPAAA